MAVAYVIIVTGDLHVFAMMTTINKMQLHWLNWVNSDIILTFASEGLIDWGLTALSA